MASIDEIMNIVLKDESFYDETGGGITISGGEPFMQFNFLKFLLKLQKRRIFILPLKLVALHQSRILQIYYHILIYFCLIIKLHRLNYINNTLV